MEDCRWPVFSPEGAWWWSGAAWLPNLLPDRRWRWTGWAWVRWNWFQRLPKWFIRDLVVWLVFVTAWVPAVAVLAAAKASTTTFVIVGLPLWVLSVLSMLAWGIKLGQREMWRELGLACLAGTVALPFWYVAIAITAPDPTGQNDHAAGIGTITLSLPILIIVGLVVGLGGLVGRATRRRRKSA